MFEIAWMEFDKAGRLVTKRKTFKTAAAQERFVHKLYEKDGFYQILAVR